MARLYTFIRSDGLKKQRALCDEHSEPMLKKGWSKSGDGVPTDKPCASCGEAAAAAAANPPAARSTDPGTSHQAEERHNLTARAERQRQVLRLVQRFPDKTNGEYARLMIQEYPELPVKVAVETPHKRLSDLHTKKMIMVSGERKCSDSGYNCRTWRITEHGSAQL